MQYIFIIFIILSAISTNLLPSAPFYYLQKPSLYFSIILLIYFILQKRFTSKIEINKHMLIGITILILSQMVAYLNSIFYNELFGTNYYKAIVGLLLFIAVFGIYFYLMKQFFNTLDNYYELLYKAVSIIAILTILTAFLQQLYLLLPNVFEPLVNLYAHTFEAKWPGSALSPTGMYHIDGSYVKTTRHLSGLMEEASELSNFILVGLAPFFMGKIAISLKYSFSIKAYYKEIILITLLSIILVLSKSSSGLLNLLIVLFSIIILLFLYKKKIFILLFALFIPVIIFFILFSDIFLPTNFSHHIDKVTSLDNISTNSRFGITIALYSIFSSYFIFGVGRGVVHDFIPTHLPSFTDGNREVTSWLENGHFSILSEWGGILAEYGLIVFLLIIYFFLTIGKKLLKHTSKLNNYASIKNEQIFVTYILFVTYFTIIMNFHFVWYRSYIIILFALFWSLSTKERKKEKYTND